MVWPRGARTRIAVRVGMLAASVAILLWLTWLLRGGDLDRNSSVASIAGMVISLATLVIEAWSLRVAILQLRQSWISIYDTARLAAVADAARLAAVADALATAVKAQWEAEAGLRALRGPAPLRLTWSSTDRPVADAPEAIAGGAIKGRVTRLRLHGHLDEVAKKFLALPHLRLVVLGEPGAGKTVLAMLLTLALLRRRQSGERVPVLLPLSSWDPTAEHLHTWLVRRISEDYPALRSPTGGPAVSEQLVTAERILPILDGLDELTEQRRREAIGELDRARGDLPLVITCRSQEYQEAVAAGGRVLAAAAVVELEPVTAAEAITFLRAGAAPASKRWDRITRHLHAHPSGTLANVLSTPLMVALVRTIYSTPSRDPGELVDLARTGDQAAIERHLLEGFIPAAYTNPPTAPDIPVPRLRRLPSPDLARRWLTLLAIHLHRNDTRDLAWWQLRQLVPQDTRRLILGLMAGLVGGLGVGFAVGLTFGLRRGLMVMLAGGLAGGLIGAPVAEEAAPQWINTQIQGRFRTLISDLVVWLLIGLTVGLVAGLAAGLTPRLTPWVTRELAVWLPAGLVSGFMVGLMQWLRRPTDARLAVTPLSVLRSDRIATIADGLVVGLAGGLAGGLAAGLGGGLAGGLASGLAAGLVMGLAVGLAIGLVGAWGQFIVVRAWLAMRGQLPLQVMAFLDDAHHRGVLRQAGAVYQFRHARLQDYLADPSPISPGVLAVTALLQRRRPGDRFL